MPVNCRHCKTTIYNTRLISIKTKARSHQAIVTEAAEAINEKGAKVAAR